MTNILALNAEIPSRRRHSSRSRSRSADHDRSTQKKKRSKRRKHESKEDAKTDDEDRKNEVEKVPRQETEEEYDARLEREEQERLEEAKRRELERIKRKYESTPPASEGGVRFKGRSSSAALSCQKLKQSFRTRTNEVHRPRTSPSTIEDLVHIMFHSLLRHAHQHHPQYPKMS